MWMLEHLCPLTTVTLQHGRRKRHVYLGLGSPMHPLRIELIFVRKSLTLSWSDSFRAGGDPLEFGRSMRVSPSGPPLKKANTSIYGKRLHRLLPGPTQHEPKSLVTRRKRGASRRFPRQVMLDRCQGWRGICVEPNPHLSFLLEVGNCWSSCVPLFSQWTELKATILNVEPG